MTPPLPCQILLLADLPAAIPILAGWFHTEWSAYDHRTPDEIATQLRQNLHRDCLPITFLALCDDELIGTISLDESDLPSHDHLTPWLASLYVISSARGTGVATALITHLLTFAQTRHIPQIHLWTPGPTAMYERLGWRPLETTTLAHRPIHIMVRDEAASA